MIAEVIVDISSSEVDKIFDYIVPSQIKVEVGHRVIVPFGPRRLQGYVIALKPSSILPAEKLRPILAVSEKEAVIDKSMLDLAEFVKERYNLKVVDALRLLLPSSMRQDKVKPLVKYKLKLSNNIDIEKAIEGLRKNATAQHKLLGYFKANLEGDKTYLNKIFGQASVAKLIELGILVQEEYSVWRTPEQDLPLAPQNKIVLTPEQKQAYIQITKAQNKAQTFLLHGVTGSGKTQVYIDCIAHYLSLGKTAIMLVPEISLTPQMLKNFRQNFKDQVAVLHSGLKETERYDEWRRIKEGLAKVVIGARSAIFAPLQNLGIIIIDEEHDSSYYSQNNPRYITGEVASFRANYNNCPLVLGSATPSIESYFKAKGGEYNLLELNNRIFSKDMPNMHIVDMASELHLGNTSIFSNKLKYELEKAIKQKNQVMLFINRRGFSSFLRCTSCGHVPKCTDCDISLVYHQQEHQLKCHFCSKRYSALTVCPECKSSNLRHGAIGTQRVVNELEKIFPEVKIFRMDNDTTLKKGSHSRILQSFSNTFPAILVGTQMIAKGHDFKGVTLVGALDADLSLYFSDYRASERTFELMTQVGGRAGRGKEEGIIILQTYSPKHYVYKFSSNYDYKNFFEKELNLRKVTNFPPFTNIVRILVFGENEEKTIEHLRELYQKVKTLQQDYPQDFVYLEAMKSPVKRIKNKFRYQILMRLKHNNFKQILKELYYIENQLNSRTVTTFVELNPQNLT